MTDYERTTTRETTAVDPAVPLEGTAVRTTERAYRPAGPSGSSVIARVVTFAFGVLQAALILRIILLLLVANQGNQIVDLIMTVTDPFVAPFAGMFAIDQVNAGEARLDIAAVVALVGWTLVEMLILAGLRIFDRRDATTT
jgi:uncharacterized protein YggT (Ycf19 family)